MAGDLVDKAPMIAHARWTEWTINGEPLHGMGKYTMSTTAGSYSQLEVGLGVLAAGLAPRIIGVEGSEDGKRLTLIGEPEDIEAWATEMGYPV